MRETAVSYWGYRRPRYYFFSVELFIVDGTIFLLIRSGLVVKPAVKRSLRVRGFSGAPRVAADCSAAVQIAKPLALTFSQYSKLFVSLKRGLRRVGYDRARTTLATFRLVPAVQHAEKSRMGKGISRAAGFT